jgi:hypothetical protein
MQNRVNCIDPVHTRAITTEIGERLRLFFSKEQPEPASSLQTLIKRLSELDKDSPSIVPGPIMRASLTLMFRILEGEGSSFEL